MILRGMSTSEFPVPVAAHSLASLPPAPPSRVASTFGRSRRRRGPRRFTVVELSDVAMRGSDDVIVTGNGSAFRDDELWTPIDGRDDVIFPL